MFLSHQPLSSRSTSSRGIFRLASALALLALGAAASGASAPAPPIETAPAPAVMPDSVPDNVNPFADRQHPPPALKIPGQTVPLRIDIVKESFDGLTVLTTLINGPDFVWATDYLNDWRPVAPASDESAAFVFATQVKSRLSLSLYKGRDLMPEITTNSLIQYLAAMRASAPDSFVLLTPLTRDDPNLVNPERFSGFIGQGVAYALPLPNGLIYHVWIVDLNHQYQLVIKLASPPALLARLDQQIRTVLGRGNIRRGLGQNLPQPAK